MGSKLYGVGGEKLPSICPGITIRRIWGEFGNKQVDGSVAQRFYQKLCFILLVVGFSNQKRFLTVSWNDSDGSVSARTVLIKRLILRVQSQGHWGEETIFDWGPEGLESAWSVGSRLIFRYRDMESEGGDTRIFSYSFRYCERLD